MISQLHHHHHQLTRNHRPRSSRRRRRMSWTPASPRGVARAARPTRRGAARAAAVVVRGSRGGRTLGATRPPGQAEATPSSAGPLAPCGDDEGSGFVDAGATTGSLPEVASHRDRGGLYSAAAADAGGCSAMNSDGMGGAAGTMLVRGAGVTAATCARCGRHTHPIFRGRLPQHAVFPRSRPSDVMEWGAKKRYIYNKRGTSDRSPRSGREGGAAGRVLSTSWWRHNPSRRFSYLRGTLPRSPPECAL